MSLVRPSKSCKKLESRHSRRSFGGAKARKPRSFGRGFFRPQQPSADDRGLHHRWRRGVRVHLSLKPPLRKVAEPVTASCSQGFTKEQVYLRQLAFSKVIRSDIYFRPLHDSGEYFPSSSYSGNNFPSRFMNTSRLQRGDGRCTCPRCRLPVNLVFPCFVSEKESTSFPAIFSLMPQRPYGFDRGGSAGGEITG